MEANLLTELTSMRLDEKRSAERMNLFDGYNEEELVESRWLEAQDSWG